MTDQIKEAKQMAGRLSELELENAINDEDGGDTDEAPQATAPTPSTNGATESQYNGIMITATPEFKAAVKKAAETADKSLSAFVRDLLATTIGYTGPMSKETKRVRKYATEEERAAAQKSRNKARRDVIKSLLEKYGDEFKAQLEGALDDDDDEDDEDDE